MTRAAPADRIWGVNLRDGNPGFADSNRVMRNFPGPAVYDLTGDDEAIRWFRAKTGDRKNNDLVLVLSPTRPELVSTDPPHRLERAHLEPGSFNDGSARLVLAPDAVLQDLNASATEEGLPQSWACECGASFPHPGPLERHRRLSCEAREAPELRQRMLEVAQAEHDRAQAEREAREERERLERAYAEDPRHAPPWVRT